jgi:Uncharacterised nucleotidyltransferase
MSQLLETERNLLLDLLFGQQEDLKLRTASVSPDGWQRMDAVATFHRLQPMLDYRYRNSGGQWAIPHDIVAGWAASFRRSAMRGLASQNCLNRLGQMLDTADIPYAALKGSWLSHFAYPHPGLRRMRDIDILVFERDVLRAFDLMRQQGFVRMAEYIQPVEDALAHAKHLPPLLWPQTGIPVEVHHHLIGGGGHPLVKPGALAPSVVLDRRIRCNVGGAEISFLDPVDTLLHLIVHAAVEHHFDNGPLLLTDIAWLISTTDVDWDRFWDSARSSGWTRHAALVFQMLQSHCPQPLPDGAKEAGLMAPQTLIRHAEESMVRFFDARWERAAMRLGHGQSSLIGKVQMLAKRALPKPYLMAALVGLRADHPLVWLIYPIWLGNRVWRLLMSQINPRTRQLVTNDEAMDDWLTDAAP